jgi:hypothetical protein
MLGDAAGMNHRHDTVEGQESDRGNFMVRVMTHVILLWTSMYIR